MSSDHDPVAGHLGSSAGSNDQRASTALDSSWIRRLHVSSTIPSPRTQTVSSNESRTPEVPNIVARFPASRVVKSEEEHGEEEVSGFGPFQFKVTNQPLTSQIPILENAGLDSEQVFPDKDGELKVSPFFRFCPPLPTTHLASPKFPQRLFSTPTNYHGGDTDTAPTARLTERVPNIRNQEEEPFSYWNMGRFNRASQIPLGDNLQMKRKPIRDMFSSVKFRRSGDEL